MTYMAYNNVKAPVHIGRNFAWKILGGYVTTRLIDAALPLTIPADVTLRIT